MKVELKKNGERNQGARRAGPLGSFELPLYLINSFYYFE
jgi:hypothetical protein